VDNNNDGGGSTAVVDDLSAAVDDVVPAALHTMQNISVDSLLSCPDCCNHL
jgi:hypothetical protein